MTESACSPLSSGSSCSSRLASPGFDRIWVRLGGGPDSRAWWPLRSSLCPGSSSAAPPATSSSCSMSGGGSVSVRSGPLCSLLRGSALGAHLLDILSADVLRIIIGVAVLTFTVTSIQGFRKRIRNEKLAMARWDSPVVFWGKHRHCGPARDPFPCQPGLGKADVQGESDRLLFGVERGHRGISGCGGSDHRVDVAVRLDFHTGNGKGALTGVALAGRVREKLFRRIALSVVAAGGPAVHRNRITRPLVHPGGCPRCGSAL